MVPGLNGVKLVMKYKIYKQSKSAMQSGNNNTKNWCLEPIQIVKKNTNSPFGWTETQGTFDQIKVFFKELDNAVSFARKNNLDFEIFKPNRINKIKKSYSENFKPKKIVR